MRHFIVQLLQLSPHGQTMPRFAFLFMFLFLLCVFSRLASAAPRLPASEIKALKRIAMELKWNGWDFSEDPCVFGPGWVDPNVPGSNNVTCQCTDTDGCHVVAIVIKSKSLSGTLPRDLSGLPELRFLDLTRNYINGTIPSEWGSTKLVKISLLGNRVTGPIPKEIGNISTLRELVVEYNQLSGALPPELGNLTNINHLFLTSNYFTGELPETLGKLSALTDLRIGDNLFTGHIPDFLQNLTMLQRLYIHGTNLRGPIPRNIGLLNDMHDLKVSDLVGGIKSEFPPLSKMKNLSTLILRNCNLVGNLPDYWDKLTSLQTLLDLSFNNLTGELPRTLTTLANIQYMFLTDNLLSGNIPDEFLQDNKQFDFSFNNFNTTPLMACKSRTPNLFASSSKGNASENVQCLNKCPSRKIQSLNINCGGPAKEINKIPYDKDEFQGGASTFFSSSNYWVFINTGTFISSGNVPSNPATPYTQKTTVPLLNQKDNYLYSTGRASPLSLAYYGYCLENGNYTVQLHFAEIVFTNDNTYKSLGRRVFDIFIQRKLVFKDFNIEDEAGGVGIPCTIKFNTSVEDHTLEIRLYWAGKGTDAIPEKGNYGPLISAITVSPDLPISRRLATWVIIVVVIAVALVFIALATLTWWCFSKKEYKVGDGDGLFTMRQIKSATNNFSPSKKIGEGGFGSVYKGVLPDGTPIAVKKLSSVSKQGAKEFLNEIGVISALRHPHLVTLCGCCVDGTQLLLVYEFMDNNSLARALYGPKRHRIMLDWPTRVSICLGIARGLCYLHEESKVKIVHRDIKSTNVLLDKHLTPKISDFGLARLTDDDATHVSTKIAGTYGYIAPEYAMRGQLSNKADVYSFGVVLLEIVSGQSSANFRPVEADYFSLLDWALFLKQRGRLLELVDKRMGIAYNPDEVFEVVDVALLCTSLLPALRPAMSSVVTMLADVSRQSFENSCRVVGCTGVDAGSPDRLLHSCQISTSTSV